MIPTQYIESGREAKTRMHFKHITNRVCLKRWIHCVSPPPRIRSDRRLGKAVSRTNPVPRLISTGRVHNNSQVSPPSAKPEDPASRADTFRHMPTGTGAAWRCLDLTHLHISFQLPAPSRPPTLPPPPPGPSAAFF